MKMNEKDIEFINYIMENSDGTETTIGDFVIKNDFGRNAYYVGKGGDVTIPSEIDGRMGISWNEIDNITSLTFPNTFEEISVWDYGKDKIPFNEKLRELKLPDGLKKIWGEACFGDCVALEKVYIPDSLEYLGHNTFKNSPWLEKNLEKVDGCYYLGKFLYKSDKEIEHATIRKGTIMIGGWAFKGCKKLQSVQIPDSVKTIGSQAFAGCENLESIICPLSVEIIEESAFANCMNLRQFKAYNSKLIVADNAFASPTRTSFHVPEDIYIPNVRIDSMKPIQKMFYELCFLQGMGHYSEEEKIYYSSFVKKNKKKLLEYIIEENLTFAFRNICDLCVKKKEMENIIFSTNQKGRHELTAIALDLK